MAKKLETKGIAKKAAQSKPGERSTNLAFVRGVVQKPGEERALPGARSVVTLPVRADTDDGRTIVPLAWTNPPAWVSELVAGDGVVATGVISQRFFASGGATQSRTEFVVRDLARARDARAVRRVTTTARDALNAAIDDAS